MADDKKLILPYVEEPTEEELEKKNEEAEKEVKKVLEDELKVADELNGDEHKEAMPEEPKMPKNEKLILKEPVTNINEDLGNDDLKDFVYDVRDSLKGICDKYSADARDMKLAWDFFRTNYNFGDGDDYDESLDSSKSGDFNNDLFNAIADVMFKYRDEDVTQEDVSSAFKEFMRKFFLDVDESLDEALPKDLAKAYRRDSTKVGSTNDYWSRNDSRQGYKQIKTSPYIDFQNSEYTPISKEEAMAYKKNGEADKLRVIFDGQLVTFDEKGRQTSGQHRAEYGGGSRTGNYDLYKKKNGDYVGRTNYLPFNDIIDRAEKIYVANEVEIPQELRRSRSKNPESKNWSLPGGMPSRDLIGDWNEKTRPDTRPTDYWEDRYIRQVKENPRKIKELQKQLEEIPDTDENRWDRGNILGQIRRLTSELEDAKDSLNKLKRERANYNARRRYYNSEVELQAPFEKLDELKDGIRNSERRLKDAKDEYAKLQVTGSPKVQEYKNDIANTKRNILRLKKELAQYEVLLMRAQDSEEPELKQAEANVTAMADELAGIQDELNKLLRRS